MEYHKDERLFHNVYYLTEFCSTAFSFYSSVNQRKLLAVHEYFVGETLPAHLSPFVSTERRVGDYVPPEERRLLGLDQEEEEEEQQQEEDEEEGETSFAATWSDSIECDSTDSLPSLLAHCCPTISL